jgi:hypothetical protein
MNFTPDKKAVDAGAPSVLDLGPYETQVLERKAGAE